MRLHATGHGYDRSPRGHLWRVSRARLEGRPVGVTASDLLHGRHSENVCPCRKSHHVAPKPAPPDAPPNGGKAARQLREAFDKLVEVSETGDESAMATAALAVPRTLPLADYAAAYEHYVGAMRDWSPEVCGDCGASLLAVTGPGCARCMDADIFTFLTASAQGMLKD